MRKLLRSTTTYIGIVLLVGIAAGVFVMKAVRAQNVRVPFLMQTEWRHPASDGGLETTFVTTDAVRSDGSWLLDTYDASGVSLASRIIAIVPTKQIYHYNSQADIRTTRTLGASLLQQYGNPLPNDCLSARPGPGTATCVDQGDSVLGYRAMLMTHTFYPTKTYQMRIEELVAPDLNWRTLSYSAYKDNVLVEQRVTRYVVMGEPAPGLFSPPTAGTAVAGSDFNRMASSVRNRR